MATNNKTSTSTKIGVGIVLTAAAATAAGAYFLYGKDGAKNRKAIKGWVLRAKGEVLEKLETLKEVNEEAYNNIIDAVAKRYQAMKNVDTVELAKMVDELKGHWRNINKQITPKQPKRKPAKRSSQKSE